MRSCKQCCRSQVITDVLSFHVTLVIIAPDNMKHCCKMFIKFNSHLLISQCKIGALLSTEKNEYKWLRHESKADLFRVSETTAKINNQVSVRTNLCWNVLKSGFWSLVSVFGCFFNSIVLILCVTWCFAVLKLSIGVYTSAFGKVSLLGFFFSCILFLLFWLLFFFFS